MNFKSGTFSLFIQAFSPKNSEFGCGCYRIETRVLSLCRQHIYVMVWSSISKAFSLQKKKTDSICLPGQSFNTARFFLISCSFILHAIHLF